jgi:Flp pilus assembly protein TadB
MSGAILAGMPLFAAGGMMLFAPGYFTPFFDPVGPWTFLLPLGAVSIAIGWGIMQKIIDIEV